MTVEVLATPSAGGVGHVQVTRHGDGAPRHALSDVVIDEQPVALVYNGLSHVVMMATPLDLEDLGLGFSLSEGLLRSVAELRGIEVQHGPLGVSVQLEVSPRAFARFKDTRRQLAGRTGCGLCGVESLQAFHDALPRPAPGQPHRVTVDTAAIGRAFRALPDLQVLQAQTGGCHAAAWSTPAGQLSLVREDVGRHNALDKLVGTLAKRRFDPRAGFVVVTSRASYEMVQKTAAAGIGLLAAVSAPTAYAARLAEAAHLTLIGLARAGRLTAYSHIEQLSDQLRGP